MRTLGLEQLAADKDAGAIGHRLYLDNCAACHGPKALGNHAVGAPDLTDADWLYGGPLQAAFLRAPWVHALLANIVGLPVRQTGGGTFTYYCRAGDHLALHRDILTCDVAVITALRNDQTDDSESGALAVYPHAAGLPLSVIRARPCDGRLLIDLDVGQTCVLLGGLVPHALLPTAPGQRRIVSVACFEALPTRISSGIADLSRTLCGR